MRRRKLLRLGLTVLVGVAAVAPASAYPRPGETEPISVTPDGLAGNGPSGGAAISADGRYVAFQSQAKDLVQPHTTNLYEVYVRDRLTGVTELVSVGSDGERGRGMSLNPDITPDGRHVAFTTSIPFDPRDENRTWDVYVRDRLQGTTTLASVDAGGGGIELGAGDGEIGGDGRFVAFASGAPDVVADDTNQNFDVFVRDLEAGTTELVSIAPDGRQFGGETYWHELSADGRRVTLEAIHEVGDDGLVMTWQVFVRDLDAGRTELVSVNAEGEAGNATSYVSDISADGQVVSFVSYASNLVPNNVEPGPGLYVRDLARGTTERVCISRDWTDPDGSCFDNAISGDGRFVAFSAGATRLVEGDTNQKYDVFVYDRIGQTTERVSVASDGSQPDAGSGAPAISAHGEVVAFASEAALVGGDENGKWDVHVRERGAILGVSGLRAVAEGGSVTVSGRGTFSPASIAAASDPPDDADPAGAVPARDVGAELVGAAVVVRPELGDLLVRWHLAELPGSALPPGAPEAGLLGPGLAPGVAGSPATVYTLRTTVAGATYEIRGASVGRGDGAPAFALFRCGADGCAETAKLAGHVGTTGVEASTTVPLSALGAGPSADLTELRVSAGIGSVAQGVAAVLDTLVLDPSAFPEPLVEAGLARPGLPPEDYARATLADGRFRFSLPFAEAASDVSVRACLGLSCVEARAPIS